MVKSFVVHLVGDETASYRHWNLRSDAERFAEEMALARDHERIDTYLVSTSNARNSVAKVKNGGGTLIDTKLPMTLSGVLDEADRT